MTTWIMELGEETAIQYIRLNRLDVYETIIFYI